MRVFLCLNELSFMLKGAWVGWCSLQLSVRDLHYERDELLDVHGHKPRRRCSDLRVQCGFLRRWLGELHW